MIRIEAMHKRYPGDDVHPRNDADKGCPQCEKQDQRKDNVNCRNPNREASRAAFREC